MPFSLLLCALAAHLAKKKQGGLCKAVCLQLCCVYRPSGDLVKNAESGSVGGEVPCAGPVVSFVGPAKSETSRGTIV